MKQGNSKYATVVSDNPPHPRTRDRVQNSKNVSIEPGVDNFVGTILPLDSMLHADRTSLLNMKVTRVERHTSPRSNHVEVPTCLVRREYLFSHTNKPVYDESVRSSRKRHHCTHQY
jgi:hypothetical protein